MPQAAARILDEYLVASARLGDRKAFEMLAERWNGKFMAHAVRLTGDVDTSREAVQSAWVDIVRGLGRLREDRAFAAWAYRIVSRRCAGQIGSAVHRRALSQALSDEAPNEPLEIPQPAEGQRLREAMAALPPGQRSAIALFYLEDMSVAEVAVALDVPVGTVKTRLMHARRKLRAAFEGDDHA